jgi:HTH-type transcriptional regulator/antitoxin HigA
VTEPDPAPGLILGPGPAIVAELEHRGWTQKDLAEILGRPIQAVNEITRGVKHITPETAIQLGRAFGTSARMWLDLETSYRLRLAEERSPATDDVALRARLFGLAPVAEMIRRGWINAGSSATELEHSLLRFFRMETIDDEPKVPISSLRKTPSKTPEDRARIAWTMRAAWLGETMRTEAPYDRSSLLANLPHLLALATTPEQAPHVSPALSQLGVRLVALPHLPQTYLDGAAFWVETGPVVALTFRFDRLDWFWFTLAHELAHLVNDADEKGTVDEARSSTLRPRSEAAADRLAQDWLVPAAAYKEFLADAAERPTRADILDFAGRIERHPSIVLGRLQHDGVLTWSQLRDLHVPIKGFFQPVMDVPSSAIS